MLNLKDLKLKISNPEQIRESALKAIKENKELLETKVKSLTETAKNNPKVVQAWNQYVTPVIQSEKAKSTLAKLQKSFPNQPLLTKIENLLNSNATAAAVAKDVTSSVKEETTSN